MKSVIKLIMLYLCIVLCLGFSNDAYAAKGLKSIKLSKKSITLHQSYSFRISIKSKPVKAIKKVTVKSSDNSIVKVSKVSKRRFYIRACEPGNAKITVKATGKNKKVRYAYLKVNVKENGNDSSTSSDITDTTQNDDISTESPADKKQDSDISSSTTEDKTADITAPEAQVEMFVGNAHSLSPNDNRIKWESLNSNIATVSESGEIVAKSVGETNLKGTVNGQSYSCKVVVYPKGEVITNLKGEYQYCIPDKLKGYDFREKAYSSAHEFRDIIIKKYGNLGADLYDELAEAEVDLFYNDEIECGKNVLIEGVNCYCGEKDISNDVLYAIKQDIPLLKEFIWGYGVRICKNNLEDKWAYGYDIKFDKNADYKSRFKTQRDEIIAELDKYRTAVNEIDDDIKKIEKCAGLFCYQGKYNYAYLDWHYKYKRGSSSYEEYNGYAITAYNAIVRKYAVCGSCSRAFSIISNAIDVPAYYLEIEKWDHAVNLIKPNGGALRIVDTVFGSKEERYPKVSYIVGTPYETDVDWNKELFMEDIDLISELGGFSAPSESLDDKITEWKYSGTIFNEEYRLPDVDDLDSYIESTDKWLDQLKADADSLLQYNPESEEEKRKLIEGREMMLRDIEDIEKMNNELKEFQKIRELARSLNIAPNRVTFGKKS